MCDEQVSALDLSTQAPVLDLLLEVQEATGVAYLFVSHGLAVVRPISHRVAVMYHGELVELGDAQAVTTTPEHPCTQCLLMALQRERRQSRRETIASQATDSRTE